MQNTIEIKTPRLILRRFTEKDVQAFFAIMNDKDVNTYLPFFPLQTIEEARYFLQENYFQHYASPIGFRYAVCLKLDNIPIGYVNIADNDSHDLGYALKLEFWHKGIITEACKAVVEQVEKSDIPYITATHDVNNARSGAVMKNIGMLYKYSYKEQWQPKNILVTFRMYQLNFDKRSTFVYNKYWDMYHDHFIEKKLVALKIINV